MSLLLLVLSFFVTSASAEDLPKGTLPLKSVGAVANLQGCEAHVLAGTTKAANTVKTVVGVAQAQAICKEAEGDLEIAKAEAEAIKAKADAESGLIYTAAIPMMGGESVSYARNADGSVRLVTGPAADWHEYGTVVASADPFLRYGGQRGYVETDPYMRRGVPDLYRLSGGQGGVVTPLLPGTSMTPATADCGTLAECDALAKKQAALLAAQAKAK